jgi:hypothetical protein
MSTFAINASSSAAQLSAVGVVHRLRWTLDMALIQSVTCLRVSVAGSACRSWSVGSLYECCVFGRDRLVEHDEVGIAQALDPESGASIASSTMTRDRHGHAAFARAGRDAAERECQCR